MIKTVLSFIVRSSHLGRASPGPSQAVQNSVVVSPAKAISYLVAATVDSTMSKQQQC